MGAVMRWMLVLAALALPQLALANQDDDDGPLALPVLTAPLLNAGLLPSGDLAPDYLCRVNDAGNAWQCTAKDGTAIPVTQGTGTTYQATGMGKVARINSLAQAPTIPAGQAALVLGAGFWNGDHTVVAPYSTGNGNTTSFADVFSNGEWKSSGFWMRARQTAETMRCFWNTNGFERSVTAAATAIDSWRVGACRKRGLTLTARTNGMATDGTLPAGETIPDPTQSTLYFGSTATVGTQLGGPLGYVAIYRRALTDAELARIEALWFGAIAETRSLTDTRAGPAWCAGSSHLVGDNALCLGAQGGAESYGPVLNYSTTSTSSTGWVANSGASITGTGPWTVTENDAVQLGYVTRAISGLTPGAGTFTFSSYIDTSSFPLRIRITSPDSGAGNQVCDFPSASPDGRYACTVTYAAGYLGNTHLYVYAGTTAAQTGAWTITQTQLVRDSTPGRRCDSGASPNTCLGDVITLPSAGFPGAEGWCQAEVRIDRLPDAKYAAILDARGSGQGYLWGISPAGELVMIAGTNGAVRRGPALTWDPARWYRLRVNFGPAGIRHLRDGAAYPAAAFSSVPTSVGAVAYLGGGPLADAVQLGGAVRNLECGQ